MSMNPINTVKVIGTVSVLLVLSGVCLYASILERRLKATKEEVTSNQIELSRKDTIIKNQYDRITNLQESVTAQQHVLSRLDEFDAKLDKSLRRARNEVSAKIPEAANSNNCFIDKRILCDEIRKARGDIGLSTSGLDCS